MTVAATSFLNPRSIFSGMDIHAQPESPNAMCLPLQIVKTQCNMQRRQNAATRPLRFCHATVTLKQPMPVILIKLLLMQAVRNSICGVRKRTIGGRIGLVVARTLSRMPTWRFGGSGLGSCSQKMALPYFPLIQFPTGSKRTFLLLPEISSLPLHSDSCSCEFHFIERQVPPLEQTLGT
jgi:hypothetical protein